MNQHKDLVSLMMFDSDGRPERNPSDIPAGVDPSKLEWNQELNRWEQKTPAYGNFTAPTDIENYYRDSDTGEYFRYSDKGGPAGNLSSVEGGVQQVVQSQPQQPAEVAPAQQTPSQPAYVQEVAPEQVYQEQAPVQQQPMAQQETSRPQSQENISRFLDSRWIPDATKYFFENYNGSLTDIPRSGLQEYFPESTFGQVTTLKGLIPGVEGYKFVLPNGETYYLTSATQSGRSWVLDKVIDDGQQQLKTFRDTAGAKTNVTQAITHMIKDSKNLT